MSDSLSKSYLSGISSYDSSNGGSVLNDESEIEITSSRTSLGLKENIEGILCYFVTWVTGLVFFVLETKNRFVRFHAMQSFLTFLVISIVLSPLQAFFDPEPNRFLDYFLVNLNPALLPYLIIYNPSIITEYLFRGMLVFSLISFLLWLFLMYKAYRGERYRLPVVGPFAEKVIESIYKS